MNYWDGKLVHLRALEPSDAEQFIRWNLDSERARNYDFIWPPQSAASVQDWVNEQSKRKLENDAFTWMIENKKGEPVGSIQTHHCNSRCGTFSYGIDIEASYRRMGYAGEAILMVLKYYFEELRYQKVTISVIADNAASIKLHEKLGFQKEGHFRRMLFSAGKYVDELWFGMTVEEFQQMHQIDSPAD